MANKTMKKHLLLSLLITVLSIKTKAQTGGCNNLDFSTGTLNNWVGQWNNQGTSGTTNGGGTPQGYGNLTVNGLNTSGFNLMQYVHELCNGGTDPHVPINRVAPGHTYSVRLGSDSGSVIEIEGSLNPLPYFHQTLSDTFMVTASNQTIMYWYAVVLSQYHPNNHAVTSQPYFKVRMYDQSGNEIICAHYDVNALSAPSIGGFDTVEVQAPNPGGGSSPYDFIYKDWSPMVIALNAYMGQKVSITFETSDCTGGGHSAYAYIAVDCNANTAITEAPPFLCNDSATQVSAPIGFSHYMWYGPGIIGSDSAQTISVNKTGTYTVSVANGTCVEMLIDSLTSNCNASGIQTILNNEGMKIYPNPATNSLQITSNNHEPLPLHIIDIIGNELMRATLQNGETTLDVSALPNGVYFIKTKLGAQKFIKQ